MNSPYRVRIGATADSILASKANARADAGVLVPIPSQGPSPFAPAVAPSFPSDDDLQAAITGLSAANRADQIPLLRAFITRIGQGDTFSDGELSVLLSLLTAGGQTSAAQHLTSLLNQIRQTRQLALIMRATNADAANTLENQVVRLSTSIPTPKPNTTTANPNPVTAPAPTTARSIGKDLLTFAILTSPAWLALLFIHGAPPRTPV